MKTINGLNPDFADFDELDETIIEAFDEFEAGTLSFEELRAQVGQDAAEAFSERLSGNDFDSLFDNPEHF